MGVMAGLRRSSRRDSVSWGEEKTPSVCEDADTSPGSPGEAGRWDEEEEDWEGLEGGGEEIGEPSPRPSPIRPPNMGEGGRVVDSVGCGCCDCMVPPLAGVIGGFGGGVGEL